MLSFLLSTLLLDMKHDATDRFMRDTILLLQPYGVVRFLHHTMHDSSASVQWEYRISDVLALVAVCQQSEDGCSHMLHRERARLDLEIEFARRRKEEGENW